MARHYFTGSVAAKIVLLASLCLIALQASGQTTRYVSPNGSDANPGTATSPYQIDRESRERCEPGRHGDCHGWCLP